MTQQTRDIVDVGIRLLREFGFPCFVLTVIGWWGQMAAVSLHTTVLVPIVESHTTFLRTTADTLETLGEAQNRQAETLSEIAAGQREIQHVLKNADEREKNRGGGL